jgi:flagellar hook-associated protein 2
MSTSAVTSSSTGSTTGTQLIQGTSYTSGNGIDVSATVAAIIQGDRAPETAWTTDQANITAQEAALTNLQTEVGTVETSFQALSDLDGVFSGVTATSSNTSALNATTSSAATSGTHYVTISNLATTGVSYSSQLDSANSTFAAGALVFTLGSGAQQTINIPGDSTTDSSGNTTTSTTTTLTNAAAYINNQSLGITASVVTDSSGARLSLTSSASGSAASVAVQSAPGGLTFTNVAGVDANLTVDGVPVTSATNSMSTAIAGVTLNLIGTSSSPIEVDVAPDTDKITTAVNSFVTAYNAAITDLNSQFQVTAGSTTNSNTTGVLETDPAARMLQEQLLSSISTLTSDNATFKTLGQLGISMGDDGTLTVDSDTLSSALANNYSDVQSFFHDTNSSSFAQTFSNLMSAMTDSTDSPIVLDLNSLKSSYTDDQNNINDLEANLTDLQTSLTSKYSTLDALLQSFPSTMDEVDTELEYNTNNNSSSSS